MQLSACVGFDFGGVDVAVTVVAAAGGCAITVFSVRVRLTGLTSMVTFVVRVVGKKQQLPCFPCPHERSLLARLTSEWYHDGKAKKQSLP